MRARFLGGFGLAILALSLTGCPPKAQVQKEPPVTEDTSKAAQNAEEPSLRGKEYQEVRDLVSIYFDLDQSSLKADARQALQTNYQTLKKHADWEVLVEGHADERGTTEYNLGLGQRRAAAVRQYYITLGMPGTRIATLSYGKEKPVCEEHNEDCWAKNRRGVTKVRVPESAAPAQ